ncbi:hypothetical protein [Coleofasciculus sp. F4-SAH-05]
MENDLDGYIIINGEDFCHGYLSFVICHLSLVICHWSLVICH